MSEIQPPALRVYDDDALDEARQSMTVIVSNAGVIASTLKGDARTDIATLDAAHNIEKAVLKLNEILTRSNKAVEIAVATQERSKSDEKAPSDHRRHYGENALMHAALQTIREHMKRMPFARREEAPEDYERRMREWACTIEQLTGAKVPDERPEIIGGSPFVAEAIVGALLRYPEDGLDELDKSMRLGRAAIESTLRCMLEEAAAYNDGPDWLPRLRAALGKGVMEGTARQLCDEVAKLAGIVRRLHEVQGH